MRLLLRSWGSVLGGGVACWGEVMALLREGPLHLRAVFGILSLLATLALEPLEQPRPPFLVPVLSAFCPSPPPIRHALCSKLVSHFFIW